MPAWRLWSKLLPASKRRDLTCFDVRHGRTGRFRINPVSRVRAGGNIGGYETFCLGFKAWVFSGILRSSTMQDKKPALSRRNLFAGAATMGAVAAASSVLPTVAHNVAAQAAPALPKPERGGGYSLSEHVQRYYKTTRV